MGVGGNGLGKSVISDAIEFVLCGLRGAALKAAANLHLLRRDKGAAICVTLTMSLARETLPSECGGSSLGFEKGQPRRIMFTRRVTKSRTVVSIRRSGCKESLVSEVWAIVLTGPSYVLYCPLYCSLYATIPVYLK